MPLPTIAIPANAGLLRAYIGCMKLLAATPQWQKETNRDEVGATERIFFPELPLTDLVSAGFDKDALPVPIAIISRPFAMPYYRGQGVNGESGSDHYYGSLALNLVLPENPAYSANSADRWADILARMEACIEQMRAKRGEKVVTDPNFNYWNFTSLSLFHRSDQDTGEPSEVGANEDGTAWSLRDWTNAPLGRKAFTSSWIIDFGY